MPTAILLLNAGATRQIDAQHFVVGMVVISGASAIGGGLVAEWNAHPPL